MASINEKLNKINTAIQHIRNSLQNSNVDIGSISQEIQVSFQVKEQEISGLNQTVEEKNTEIENLNNEIISKDQEVNKKDNEIVELKNTILTLQDGLNQYIPGDPFPITGEPISVPAGTVFVINPTESSIEFDNILTYGGQKLNILYYNQIGLMLADGLEFVDPSIIGDGTVYSINYNRFKNMFSIYNPNTGLFEVFPTVGLDYTWSIPLLYRKNGTTSVLSDELFDSLKNGKIFNVDYRLPDNSLYIRTLHDITLCYKNDATFLSMLEACPYKMISYAVKKEDK